VVSTETTERAPATRLRGLDTNVLARFYTRDDAEQSALARAVVARAEERGERLFVSVPVLCELVWTLGRPRYRARREDIVELVESLLGSPVFALQERSLVRHALDDFRTGRGGFADYLIGRCGESVGCASTLTFDEALLDHPHFEHPGGPTP
jgi:predicted nucleic-acid-binding protein